MATAQKKDPSDAIPISLIASTVICGVIATLVVAVVFSIPISMIVIGAVYLNDCPAERLIPIYLITMGTAHLVKSLITMKWRTQRSRLPQEEQADFKRNKVEIGISLLFGVFCFAYFFAGNVWIYRIYKPNTTVSSAADYCHPMLYYFAFWMTIVWYISGVSFCFYRCCTGCLAYCGVTAADDGVTATAMPAQTLKRETSP